MIGQQTSARALEDIQLLDEWEQRIAQRQHARGKRKRAHGEQIVLQLVLRQLAQQPAFKATLLGELAAAGLRPKDHAAALAVLTGPATEDALLPSAPRH